MAEEDERKAAEQAVAEQVAADQAVAEQAADAERDAAEAQKLAAAKAETAEKLEAAKKVEVAEKLVAENKAQRIGTIMCSSNRISDAQASPRRKEGEDSGSHALYSLTCTTTNGKQFVAEVRLSDLKELRAELVKCSATLDKLDFPSGTFFSSGTDPKLCEQRTLEFVLWFSFALKQVQIEEEHGRGAALQRMQEFCDTHRSEQ